MAWEPMTPEDARALLDAMAPAGTLSANQWARVTEALLVDAGAPRDQIKAAVEGVLGHPVE